LAGFAAIKARFTDLLGLPKDSLLDLVDGDSIAPLFKKEIGSRKKYIPFRQYNKAALIDNNYKIVQPNINKDKYELYDLEKDPAESKDLFSEKPEVAARLKKALDDFNASLLQSDTGADYPEGKLTVADKGCTDWEKAPGYQPYLSRLKRYMRPKHRKQKKTQNTKSK
jgi:arylsulfatase A-like enzyme